MPKTTITKEFTHNGKPYRIGDEFDGTEAEIESLARQGYTKQKAGDEEVDPGPGKGVNTSESSSGNAEVHYPPPAPPPHHVAPRAEEKSNARK